MQKTTDCNHHAQFCRAMALRAESEEQKAQYEAMATTWEILAIQQENLLRCRTLCAA